MRAVSTEDVRRVVTKYFVAANRTVGVALPSRRRSSTGVVVEEGDAEAVLQTFVDSGPPVVLGERFEPTTANLAHRFTERRLPSGLRLALLPKKTRGAAVHGLLSLDLGDSASLRGRVAAGELLARMLGAVGTRQTSSAEIRGALSDLEAQVTITSRPRPTRVAIDPFIDLTDRSVPDRGTGLDVRFSTTRTHLRTLLRLIGAVLREPRLDSVEFERVRREQMAFARDRSSQTNADYLFDSRFPALARDHPERVLLLEERTAALAAVQLDDVRRFHRDFYGASSGVLSLVGDIDADSVEQAVREVLGGWRSLRPARGAAEGIAPVPDRQASDTLVRAEPGRQRGSISIGLVLPISVNDTDYAAFTIANYIFGGSLESRLFSRIREREGLSYSIGSRLRPRVGQSLATWRVEASYDLKNAGRVRERIEAELRSAVQNGFTLDEVAVAKRGFVARLLLARGDDAALAQQLSVWTPRSLSALEERILALDARKVSEAFRRYVRVGTLTTVSVVGPATLK